MVNVKCSARTVHVQCSEAEFYHFKFLFIFPKGHGTLCAGHQLDALDIA